MPGPGTPWAIALTGPPAAGKTTTGHALARALGAALLDLDTLTNPLVEVVAGLVGAEGDYADQRLAGLVRDARYTALSDTAADCLTAGIPVVLVAPFTAERRTEQAWSALAAGLRSAGGQPAIVWLRADPDLLARRMRARGAGRDVAKLRALEAGDFVADLQPPAVAHLAVDAGLGIEEQVAAVLARLRA